MTIKRYKRPGNNKKIVSEIKRIVQSVSGKWFTKEVYESIGSDLKYQDLICIFENRKMIGFISYTCLDGKITMTLMAIDNTNRNKGYGKILYEHFEKFISHNGFKTIMVQTVPEEVNSNYKSTIEFYKRMGFIITKRYTELWEQGAIELEKVI